LVVVLEQLQTTRLLTLTGPGGSGKTRLAQVVAHAVADRFPDGVVVVALAAITDSALVLPTIARALGLSESGGLAALGLLMAAIGTQQLLLVLDNFEQVLPAAVEISALLGACPGLSVLVTSRAPLHVRGEREHPVPPLAVPAEDAPATLQELQDIPA